MGQNGQTAYLVAFDFMRRRTPNPMTGSPPSGNSTVVRELANDGSRRTEDNSTYTYEPHDV
ncbi:MAG TPA: hypothetical protein VKT78_07600 [Fimbriimonadaceae bacterium]|nr:hypothetical protein [Fimbriimonadaceae bacterium]